MVDSPTITTVRGGGRFRRIDARKTSPTWRHAASFEVSNSIRLKAYIDRIGNYSIILILETRGTTRANLARDAEFHFDVEINMQIDRLALTSTYLRNGMKITPSDEDRAENGSGGLAGAPGNALFPDTKKPAQVVDLGGLSDW